MNDDLPKSAVVLERDHDIAGFLLKKQKERQDIGFRGHTGVQIREDGRACLLKRSPPSVHRSTVQMPTAEELTKMVKKAGFEAEDGFLDRIHPVYSSDERVDGLGDIVKQNFDFTTYNTNPLVLLFHDWGGFPIGGSIHHKVQQRDYGKGETGRSLFQYMLFASEQANELAGTVQRLWQARFLRTVSIGVFPKKVIWIEDDDERMKLGLGMFGLIFDDNEFVEVSPVSVPANPRATNNDLMKAAQGGLISESDIPAVREIVRTDVRAFGLKDDWQEIDAAMRSAFEHLFPDVIIESHSDLDQPIEFRVHAGSKKENERLDRLEEQVKTMNSGLQDFMKSIQQSSTRALDSAVQRALDLADEATGSIKTLSGKE